MVAGEVTDLTRSLLDDSSCEDPPGLTAPGESGLAGVNAKSLTRLGCLGTVEGEVGDGVPPPSPLCQTYDFEWAEEWEPSSGEAGWTKMKLLELAMGSDECDL
jgi:hypothetical protein